MSIHFRPLVTLVVLCIAEGACSPYHGSVTNAPDLSTFAPSWTMAEPPRRGISSEIAAASGSVVPCCSLHEAGKLSAGTISHHIKGLETASLIDIA
jgi:hypothetical protein